MLRAGQINNHILKVIAVLLAAGTLASSQISAAAAPAIAQSFQSETTLAQGALVGAQPDAPRTVQPSNVANVGNMVGVVTKAPLISLGDDTNEVEVVTSGVTTVLVSDINGTIESGDKITASPIDGVGMVATKPTLIVGTAQDGLADKDTQERTITTQDGEKQTVRIGRVPIEVGVTFFAATEVQQELVPPFLQNIANTVAGEPVSPVRVIAALLVLLLGLISTIVLLYSSVRSSIISIGRNPLSEKAVHKGLIEVGATIMGILLLTFITVYLILVT